MIGLLLTLLSAVPATARTNAYQLETKWRAEDGKTIALSSLSGKQVVLSFVYTSCGATCPMTTKNLQRLMRTMRKEQKAAHVVVVSLDPEHDTSEAVVEYRKRYGLTANDDFEVLVGDESALRKLTMLLDFRFSKNPESGAIMHDNKIFLLSERGEVLVMIPSLDEAQGALIAAIRPAVTPSTADKR